MTTTSPAPPASRPTIPNRLAGLRRRIPTVVLFATVPFTGWGVDYALVLTFNSLTDSVLYAVVGARIVSCTLGLLLNRRLFGAGPENCRRSAGGYVAIQGGVVATSYAGITILTGAGASLWLAKVLVDSTLFIVNYLAQPRLVYRVPAQQPVPVPALATTVWGGGAEAQDWASRMGMTSWTRSRRSSLIRIRVTFFLTESGARMRR